MLYFVRAYVMLNAAPFRAFHVSTWHRHQHSVSQFLCPGPNSTGRRRVTCIRHFVPKFNFPRASSAGTNSRSPSPARSRPLEQGRLPLLCLFNLPTCAGFNTAGANQSCSASRQREYHPVLFSPPCLCLVGTPPLCLRATLFFLCLDLQ